MTTKNKPRAVHYGERRGIATIETLCGKYEDRLGAFHEYGHVTTDASRVTCKACLAAIGRRDARRD